MTLQDKQEAFLLDTISYYSADPVGRRCLNEAQCFYSPQTIDKPLSDGCAIGRMLPSEVSLKLDELYPKGQGIDSILKEHPELIPQNIKELGDNFLSMCQHLHDTSDYWDKKGLSERGKERLKVLVEQYELSESKFQNYLTNGSL